MKQVELFISVILEEGSEIFNYSVAKGAKKEEVVKAFQRTLKLLEGEVLLSLGVTILNVNDFNYEEHCELTAFFDAVCKEVASNFNCEADETVLYNDIWLSHIEDGKGED